MIKQEPRCWYCQARIKFDSSQVGPKGKVIPLELYGGVHNCPNKKFKNKIITAEPAAPSAAEKAVRSDQIARLVYFIENLQRENKLLNDRVAAIERRLEQ